MVYINGKEFGNLYFPNGEINFKEFELNENKEVEVTVYFDSNEDLFKLMILGEALEDMDGSISTLSFPYFPYSAMDRKMSDQLFTLKYMANIINKLHATEVHFFDPHSEVMTELVENSVVLYEEVLQEILVELENHKVDVIMLPDAGAHKKYLKYFKYFPICYGNKVRNKDTGKIVSYEVVGGEQVEGKNVMIIDDICRKGGTFMHASDELKKLGAKEVTLFVTFLEKSARTQGGILDGSAYELYPSLEKLFFFFEQKNIDKKVFL